MHASFFMADSTIQEYELFARPIENHLREDQMDRLVHDGAVFSGETSPVVQPRKELPDDVFEIEKALIYEFFDRYGAYVFTFFTGDYYRFYNAYCWSRYKEKKKSILECSTFLKLVDEFLTPDDKTVEPSEKEKEIKREEGKPADADDGEGFHFFDEEQWELRLKMYEEAVYARHAEFHYEKFGEFPDAEELMGTLREKISFERNVIERFVSFGKTCEALSERRLFDDSFFSFEDGKFLFIYGKSIYKFSIIGSDFYLKGEKVDLPLFFENLRSENRRVMKHWIRLGKLFERKGISYNFENNKNPFYLYRVVDEEDLFYLRYKKAEMMITWDKRNFYRLSGEQIKTPQILVHEMIEKDASRKKALLKAKQYFQVFLTKEEKQRFAKTKAVQVKGKQYDYVFCPELSMNSIIRIEKETGKKESMCVMFDDPYIPRYDVIASAMLLVKTGQEEQLNQRSNVFSCNENHENILKKMTLS